MSIFKIPFPSTEIYESFSYPAGEQQVRIREAFLEPIRTADGVEITARIQSSEDLIRLLLLADALHNTFLIKPILRIPYLPYARADRRFTQSDCHGLKMMGELLSLGKFSHIETYDVHSERAFDWIAGLVNISPLPLIQKAMAAIRLERRQGTILLPDEGALGRYAIPNWPVLHATKKRNEKTGKLEGFEVPKFELFGDGPILIVDDICDGGGTFLGIAALLTPDIPRYLFVTHGIFSKGFDDLGKAFELIFTTDSLPQQESDLVRVFSLEP